MQTFCVWESKQIVLGNKYSVKESDWDDPILTSIIMLAYKTNISEELHRN